MITVVTPFKRIENKELLTKALEGKCEWVVLQASDEPEIDFPSWVTVKRFEIARKDTISNRLFNEFISAGLEDDTQYMILCDDDSIEEGFFDKIPNDDVVIVSMKRSDRKINHVVWDDFEKQMGHWEDSIDILKANPESMRIGNVGGEQAIIKGKILRNFRYGLSNVGDGEMILKVIQEHNVTFQPNAHVLFNYFEDGRFESFKRERHLRTKPVALFIGDYFCAGQPSMGLSEWEGNIWSSLESTGMVEVARFHFDKYYYHTGQRGDLALLDRIKEIQPDVIILIIYKHLGQDPAVMRVETIASINLPIITIWGDLEAVQQRQIAQTLEPFCAKMIGTANKEIVEGLGYTYLHVPKDPRLFNNPDKERDVDIVFSGSFGLGREERQEAMIHLLDNGIKLVHGGSEGRDHFSTEEYADRYKRAKLALSFSRAHGMNVINARPFEAMNCGAMLLEQESEELAKLYVPYVDYVPWTDKEDLLNKVKYYLEHDDERKTIASNGQRKTEELYSAKKFWEQVL